VLAQLVPSFNFPQPSITDGTDVIRPATLRGLGPDQTLVLVNGKRRHTTALLNINGSVGRGTAAVDINLIPQAALSRVEVLRDGAAAQYGSDAIAGVINFQLNRAREGGYVSATYGQYETRIRGVFETTGVARDAAGTPILAPDGTLTLTNNGRRLKVSDGETLTLTTNLGLPLGADGFANVTVEYRDRNPTNRTGYDPRRQFNLASTPQVYDPREFSFQRRSHRYGDAETQDINVFLNLGKPVGDLELYAFGSFGDRNGESAGFYRLANDNRNVPAIYAEGFLPLITTTLRDYAGTVGIKGDVGEFTFDLSAGYARNEFDFRIKNTLNASIGRNSKTEFDSGGLRYSQFIANLDVTRNIPVSFKELTLAAGLEYRDESYQIRPGEPDSYRSGGVLVGANNPAFTGAAGNAPAAPGAQVFPGFQPIIGGQNVTGKRSRHSYAAYVELDADLADWWSVQAAGRYEDYSDFGDTLNGKLATRLEFVPGLAGRASVSTGFRAPSLQQQFFAAAATNNVNGVLLDTVTLPVNNPIAQALGAQPLRPEKSFNWSAGLVINPVSALSITVDYYAIDITDRIVVTENLQASRDAAGQPTGANPGQSIARILNNAGFTSTAAARFFINGIDTSTQGIDAVATYRFAVGDTGRVGLTAGFNYNKTRITGTRTAPGALSQVPGIVLFGRQESLRTELGQPRSKLNLGLDLDREPFGLTLRANRYGRVLGAGPDAFSDVIINPAWVTDLEVRFEPIRGLNLAVGANNLFDVYPDPVPTGRGVDPATGAGRNYPATNYVANFSNFSPFGFNGRFLYGRVSYRF
jgi:iron complex outermembrane receptor protein